MGLAILLFSRSRYRSLAEINNISVISAHSMIQLFQFPSWRSHIPCSNRDVLPTSNFLDLWYTSGILVTCLLRPGVKRSLISRFETGPVLRL